MLKNAYTELGSDVSIQSSPPIANQPSEPQLSGSIIVRLRADIPTDGPADLTLLDFAQSNEQSALATLLQDYDLFQNRRLINSIDAAQILQLEALASATSFPPLNSLTAYWRIDARAHPSRMSQIIEDLNALFEVDIAYAEFVIDEPSVDPSNDLYNALQDYQNAAPEGIASRSAWTYQHGAGEGIGFVDIERGWTLTHEDICPHGTTAPIFGVNHPMEDIRDHGTASLGVVAGYDTPGGSSNSIVGIAPNIASLKVASHYDGSTSGHVAQAITHALLEMNPGDVLLLEVQSAGKPVEIEQHNFDAIRLASALGIIVIEAAGNAFANLDAFEVLNPTHPNFRESGAIIVSGATDGTTHHPINFVHGLRVNCFAWGEGIVTAGKGGLGSSTGVDDEYRKDFAGTSGASAIIAGAALVVQSRYAHVTGSRLSPLQMRAILSNPTTGTGQGAPLAHKIGVMPDLKAIFTLALNIVPDVYARDYIGDTGAVPTSGMVCASPDIIAETTLHANPGAIYGEGTAYANSNAFGSTVEAGVDNYIYVRMKNRGVDDAPGVTASVYWSETATLITPAMWNLIGNTAPLDVPQGNTLHVSDALTWDRTKIPGSGHYCFIAILNHPEDPAPLVPASSDWDAFLRFIKHNNNVVWRNFNVVDNLPILLAEPIPLPFAITGAPERTLPFEFEILQHLPRGTSLILEMPMSIGSQLKNDLLWSYDILPGDAGGIKIRLPTQPALPLKRITLPAASHYACRFLVQPPRAHRLIGHEIAIRQLYEGEEVGRVTWHLLTEPVAPETS